MWLFSDYRLDDCKRVLHGKSGIVRLEPRVMELLLYLVRNHDRAVSKQELLEHVWSGVSLERSAVPGAIKKLRRSLEAAPGAIATLRGYGFRFATRVVELPAAERAAPTITALPFRTFDATDRELGSLLADDLLMRLHEYRLLPVLAPDSTRWAAPSSEAEEGLPLPRYLIRGSLWRMHCSAVASVQLIDTQHTQVVWSLRTSTSEQDPGSAIDALSAQIAAALCTGFALGGVTAAALGARADTASAAPEAGAWSDRSETARLHPPVHCVCGASLGLP